ncbi:MAG: phosphoenolpyruvate synthase [Gammaproteobacteria bacterium]|nr:phosphoenolpyruvate synthase [Gammaproteobacteria bacterium]
MENILQFTQVGLSDAPKVGGKNASLGEMIRHLTKIGINVPDGFAVTTSAYKNFLSQKGLDSKIYSLLENLNTNDIASLAKVSLEIRELILNTPFPAPLIADILEGYDVLGSQEDISVAVRSSATAEDLPGSSFAGQQDSYLNVRGGENVLEAIKQVYASLFTGRAIAYRTHHGFDHSKVAISVGVQKMVRSDVGTSGVVFTLDTESGFEHVVFITASYGLGENIVQGAVNPDEFFVHKPTLLQAKHAIIRKNLGSKTTKKIYREERDFTKTLATVEVNESEQARFCLSDVSIQELAHQAIQIENHYQRHMDIEWALDGMDGKLYIVQARPETVKSLHKQNVIERYRLIHRGEVIAQGRSIGDKIGQGKARVIMDPRDMQIMQTGEVLVTDMTDPDWEPVMKRAGAIVTNRGGRTCHAAIIARELGIPAVVGCGDASEKIGVGQPLTVSCAEGETGYVYAGLLAHEVEQIEVDSMPPLPIKICMNLGNPEKAFSYQAIPNEGVGLARLEFIINNMIGIHPRALLELNLLPLSLKKTIEVKTGAYESPIEFYIEKLREGIGTIAAAFYPKPVIVRFSDFKSNEYANLLGGSLYEPKEENPMLGYRGASRYLSAQFRECFRLECIAIKRVRENMGLTNTKVMIPFVRTVDEAKNVNCLLDEFGLKRGKDGLEVYMMCEVPSNAILAQDFLEHFDGFSIGSNDLTQLTLGLDRDSSLVASLFEERNAAVKSLLHNVIQTCHQAKKYVGICGQGPSDHPDFARWLMDEGITSISLSPDSVVSTWMYLAGKKQ